MSAGQANNANFAFCTGSSDALAPAADNRRFWVIEPEFTESEDALMNHLTQLLAARRSRSVPGNGTAIYPQEPTMSPSTDQPHLASATDILVQASDTIDQRAQLRDSAAGERSMCRAVAGFNAMYGTRLTEQQGWQFMVLLKMARSAAGATHRDDFIDQAAYSALAGECAAHHAMAAISSKPYAST